MPNFTLKIVNLLTEKQRTVMTVTETFMVKRVLEITRLSAVKRKTQFANRCIVVKIALQNSLQRNSTSADTVNVSRVKISTQRP